MCFVLFLASRGGDLKPFIYARKSKYAPLYFHLEKVQSGSQPLRFEERYQTIFCWSSSGWGDLWPFIEECFGSFPGSKSAPLGVW